jgi:DNA invertase Pin-like site-specific DNA recombinase
MRIGYARVSINEQNLALQQDALLRAGVYYKNIYTDKVNGVKSERPRLTQALSRLRVGDTFIVWRLDRLGRSLKHLIETVTALKNQGIVFKSLTENIDTATPTGKHVFEIFGVLAEFERNLINEWTMAGLEEARTKGRKAGRPPHDPSSDRVAYAKQLYSNRAISVPEILQTLNISKTTFYRWLDLPAAR